MLEIFKNKARKICIIRIIALVVIFIIICAVMGTSLLYFITGPEKISKVEKYSGLEDLEDLEGKYVSYDAKCVLLQFAEHTTLYEDTGNETVNGGNYLVYDDEKQIFFGVYLSKSKEEKVFDLIDESWKWLYEEIEDISFSIPVKGTWTLISGKLLEYYKDTITEYFGSDLLDMASAYYIDSSMVGAHSKTTIYIFLAVLAADILLVIYTFIQMLNGSYDKHIKKYISDNPQTSLATIESDFTRAHAYLKSKTWVGQRFTIYMKGIHAYIFSNKDIVWAYYYKRTGRYAVSEIRTYTMSKKLISVSMSEANAMEALKNYNEEQLHMVVGYSKDFEAMFNKNFNEFLNMKYNPYMQEQNTLF